MVETISGSKPYPLRAARSAVAVIDAVRADGHPNIALIMDLYHLASGGDDIDAAIAQYASCTAHVQIADFPGRGEPGTGGPPLERYLDDLVEIGYAGEWAWSTSRPQTR